MVKEVVEEKKTHTHTFPRVLRVRRARSHEMKHLCLLQVWASDEHEVMEGLSSHQTYPAPKKNLKRGATFSKSRLFQQLFSAACLTSLFQQPTSAALLSILSQQPFSAAFLSSFQQPFSAAFLSSFSQLPSPASYHLAVVRGWWSAIIILLLWSRVGGQL